MDLLWGWNANLSGEHPSYGDTALYEGCAPDQHTTGLSKNISFIMECDLGNVVGRYLRVLSGHSCPRKGDQRMQMMVWGLYVVALSRVASRQVGGAAGSQQRGHLWQLLLLLPISLSLSPTWCRDQRSSSLMIMTKLQTIWNSKQGRGIWVGVGRKSFKQIQELELDLER